MRQLNENMEKVGVQLSPEELRKFLQDMNKCNYDAWEWATKTGVYRPKTNSILSFLYDNPFDNDSKIRINPIAVQNFANAMRNNGHTWINFEVEEWAKSNAHTPYDIVKKLLENYREAVNREKAEIYRLMDIEDPGGVKRAKRVKEIMDSIRAKKVGSVQD